ncbi:MAG: TIR domain-containing protein [Planctomycetes bacterium]|nr:TIR domain-containing protein [Planctomycetota bacterium]
MQTEFDYDVFISYSSKDETWVRGELLQRIEQAGLKAFIDFRDFTRGAPSIKECERGVVKCRKTLIVLTPDYLKSGWAEFENIMVQTLDPANESLRLIPLLKVKCKKPLRIGALTHIDFTDGADHDLAWRQLLTALGAPPEPVPTPEPQRDHWFLAHPYSMPPNFTGRVLEREMLTGWLNAEAAHPLLSLRALGGFGKSALAWHWLTHDVDPTNWPRVVWWSFYEGDASFDNFLNETLQYLSGGKTKPGTLPPRVAINEILHMLHEPGTLLVLDGFERVLRAFSGLNAAYQGDEVQHEAPGAESDEGNDRDCISPLADLFLHDIALLPNLRSRALLTTRLCPRVLEAKGGGLLEGCREEELRQMQPADAVAFFCA